MPRLVLFGLAREAAGVAHDTVEGATLDAALAAARDRYGAEFARVLETCRVWVNGDPAPPEAQLAPTDEVAVLPPVSGG